MARRGEIRGTHGLGGLSGDRVDSAGIGGCGLADSRIDPEQRELHPPDGAVGGRGRASNSGRRICGCGDE